MSDVDRANASTAVVLRQELDDLHEELAAHESRRRRHWLWAAVGVSPAAILPIAAALWLGTAGWILGALLLMPAMETVRALRKGRDVRRISAQIREVEGELASPRVSLED